MRKIMTEEINKITPQLKQAFLDRQNYMQAIVVMQTRIDQLVSEK